jgi:ATP-binding cassette subfamily B protein
MTYRIVRDIRNEAFRKIEILPLSYIDSHSYGEVVSRVIADVDQFADGLLMGFTQFFTGVITILGTLGFMLSVNVAITGVVVLVTPLSFFVAGFIAKKTFTMFKLQSETRGEQTAFIEEIIGNQKVVQAFSHEDESMKDCRSIL